MNFFVPTDPYEPYDIYILVDPRDNAVYYIGITTNVVNRYKQHLKKKDCNALKTAWIQDLQKQGLLPQLHIIERVKGLKPAKERERYWFHFYGKQGSPLTNIHGNPYDRPKNIGVVS